MPRSHSSAPPALARASSPVYADRALFVACAHRASRLGDPAEEAGVWLDYLGAFPLGEKNRDAAERVERLVPRIPDADSKARVATALRDARAPYLPPLDPFG